MNVNNLFEDDIKSNTDNEINSNKFLQINQANKLFEETKKQRQLINNILDNNNPFKQNTNFFNYNIYNSINNFRNNSIIMNFVNNINNSNILLSSNNQNLNKDNPKKELNNKIPEKNVVIEINDIDDCLDNNNNIKN